MQSDTATAGEDRSFEINLIFINMIKAEKAWLG